MNIRCFLSFGLALLLTGSLFAETPEERAKKVTVTMTLNDVPASAAAHFVEVVTNIKVHYVGHPGNQTMLSLSFDNTSAHEAFKYIADLARLDLIYRADGAHFSPKK